MKKATANVESVDGGWRRDRPEWGWHGRRSRRVELQNPRPPAVPATLQLTLPEYFTAAATIGLLAAQSEEPDPEWLAERSLDYGYEIARQAEARRRKK